MTTGPGRTPFEQLGGEENVRALVEAFYDAMDAHEPALAKLHQLDEQGRVSRRARDRFAMFLIGWLGGPQYFIEQVGHPRLRMRHAKVPVDVAMRDAWVRAMRRALDDRGVTGDVRAFLETKFAEVADFLRNRAG